MLKKFKIKKEKVFRSLVEDELMSLKIKKFLKEKELADRIQSHYKFKIPMYILLAIVELFEADENGIKNLFTMINIAVLNDRISNENANIIKKDIIYMNDIFAVI